MSGFFSPLVPQPEDQIIKLMGQFSADPRSDKVDLGVGVYRNAEGVTPVMRAVKAAEQQLWQSQDSKSYTALAGEAAFRDAMADLILGDSVPRDRMASLATVGGTGAVFMAGRIIQMARAEATVWISDPSWPNHVPIMGQVGLRTRSYRYFDADSRAVTPEAMLQDLEQVQPGDVVLLHGCCHNPTGANPSWPLWQDLAALLAQKGAVPLIDLAYQGFGDGLEQDAQATRLLAQSCEHVLIAASCSKNFGLYRERTGVLLALSAPEMRNTLQGNLSTLNRLTYSFPPDHGARLVSMILNDAALRQDWQQELEAMRIGMLELRAQLAQELRALTGSDRFGFLAEHRGMFSRLGASPEQVQTLREEHGIYMVGDSRMNIAGLNSDTVGPLARAISQIIG